MFNNYVIIKKCKKIYLNDVNNQDFINNAFNSFVNGDLFSNSTQNNLVQEAISSGDNTKWFSSVVDSITYFSKLTPDSHGGSTEIGSELQCDDPNIPPYKCNCGGDPQYSYYWCFVNSQQTCADENYIVMPCSSCCFK